MALRTGNPALKTETFTNYSTRVSGESSTDTMTLEGVANKTGLMLLFTVGLAGVTWKLLMQGNLPLVMTLMIGGMIVSFILSMIMIFKPESSPKLALVYAMAEGLTLGGISAVFEMRYPGIALQAVSATFGTMLCMLAAYRSGMIKATENFKLGLLAAMGGILVVYLGSLIMNLVGMHVPYIHSSGPVGIAFSLVVVVVAALNFVLDFDFIEKGVEAGAPKFMEWYAAFSLMLTLIWLYLEMLRLLAKLRGRD